MKSHESYISVIERLKVYRNKIGLSQNEMGKLLGVTQSHYYKLENGLKIISRRSLLSFQAAGQDIFWLITGRESKNYALDRYIKACETERERQKILDAFLWVTEEGMRIAGIQKDESLYKAHKLMRACGLYEGFIWKRIREAENLTQLQMADILDINIKRYRKIEKGEIEEDAEILSSLYMNLNYSPMIILDRARYCMDELNLVWEMFDQPLKRKMLKYMDNCLEIVKCDCI